MKKILLLAVLVLMLNNIKAQNFKFGKVSKEELREEFYPLDSSANAAILFNKRRTFYTYQSEEGWTLNTKIYERIKIYNKKGYKWATKKIKLYTKGEDEKVSIKAVTYNLGNNKIEKSKLKKNDIFNENINKFWNSKKFTMPNIKEGCVIEWEYLIRSPYYSKIDDMVGQYQIPIKKLDAEIKIPEYFIFKTQSRGHYPLNISTGNMASSIAIISKNRSNSDRWSMKTSISSDKIEFTSKIIGCKQKDIPALVKEPFINNINNYRALLKFELSATKFPDLPFKNYNTSWEDVAKTIYKSSNFGGQLEKTAHIRDDINSLVNLTESSTTKINKVFNFVKNNIKWNGYYSKYTNVGVRKAYKDGVGNVAEINLNLIILLREAGLIANPILVSTRGNGIPIFPTSEGFNYVIAGVELNGKIILLDATEQNSRPNSLPLRVMNWKGRIIRKGQTSNWVDLISKQYATEYTILQIKIEEEGLVEGRCRISYSNFKALEYRNEFMILKNDDIAQKLEEKKGGIEIQDYEIKNKSIINKPVIETFKFSSEDLIDMVGDKIYFKPLFFNAVSNSPFKLDKRNYPIDFGTPFFNKNFIQLIIPNGYSVENLPKDINLMLPNNYGSYKFKINSSANKITITTQFKINTAIFPVENYNELKEIYNLIVNKNKEQIVLKKV